MVNHVPIYQTSAMLRLDCLVCLYLGQRYARKFFYFLEFILVLNLLRFKSNLVAIQQTILTQFQICAVRFFIVIF
jgi:hypothetical protein